MWLFFGLFFNQFKLFFFVFFSSDFAPEMPQPKNQCVKCHKELNSSNDDSCCEVEEHLGFINPQVIWIKK